MAGIYIHIPFCRQKCYYCDFYKTVNTSQTENLISSIEEEVKLRQNYLEKETIETIYFGGGTPSVLNEKEIAQILHIFNSNFQVSSTAEITFEANPDDLDSDYLDQLFQSGINRLSIGIQSFEDVHLKKMNRRHNSKQAVEVVENAVKKGFKNISVDLIYGLPDLTKIQWKNSLRKALELPVQHLSAYHLTYHKGTPFYTWLKKGTLKELSENDSLQQFIILSEMAEKAGFEMYEISNFAKNSLYSQHNTSYWTGKKYIGLGPSAHSFNGKSRQWNISSVDGYLKAIKQNHSFYETEVLSKNEKYNEYILTRIRTKWGVSADFIEINFGLQTKNFFLANIEKHLALKRVLESNGIYIFSKEGLFISDDIMADLMII